MARVGIGKMLALAVATVVVGAAANQANATPITFATFKQTLTQTNTAPTPWTFTNLGSGSTFSATGVQVDFTSATAVGSQVLNFNGVAIATLTATVSGTASTGVGLVQQGLAAGADLKFVNALNTSEVVLDIKFTGAITGTLGGGGSAGASDPAVVGQAISYSSMDQVGTFQSPFSFTLSLTGPLTIAMNGYLNSFSSSSEGHFNSDSSGAAPAPLPAAAWGGLSMMSALGGVGAFIRRRRR